jgi:hypothetical protein
MPRAVIWCRLSCYAPRIIRRTSWNEASGYLAARKQRYPIQLSASEREELEKLVRRGHHSARIICRAQMRLWSDQGKDRSGNCGTGEGDPADRRRNSAVLDDRTHPSRSSAPRRARPPSEKPITHNPHLLEPPSYSLVRIDALPIWTRRGQPLFHVLPDQAWTLFQRDNILKILRVELPTCVTECVLVEANALA